MKLEIEPTNEALCYAGSKGWELRFDSVNTWSLVKDGATLEMRGEGAHNEGATLTVGEFCKEIGPEAGEVWRDRLLVERVTYYVSEAERHLELLCSFVVKQKTT